MDARIYADLFPGVKAYIMPWSEIENEYHGTLCTILSYPELREFIRTDFSTAKAVLCVVELLNGQTISDWGILGIKQIAIHANALVPQPKDDLFDREDTTGYDRDVPYKKPVTMNDVVKAYKDTAR